MLIGLGLGLYPTDWQCSPHHSAHDTTYSVPNEGSSNHVNRPDHAAPLVHGPNMFGGFDDGHYMDPLTAPTGLISRGTFLKGSSGIIDVTWIDASIDVGRH